jgi:YVTN family beta-propeller protein
MRSLRTLRFWLGLGGAVALAACTAIEESPPVKEEPVVVASGTTASTTILLTGDDSELWVVNQDADSVSVIDPETRKLVKEIALSDAPPSVDAATKRFDPKVSPRSLTLVNEEKVYVAGQSANSVYVIDAKKRSVTGVIPVPAAPIAVASAPDGSAVYVVSHEASTVTKIDPRTDEVVASVPVTEHPFGIKVSEDGQSIFVTHALLDPGVTVLTPSLAIADKVPLSDEVPGDDKRIANGVARGLFHVEARPGTGELWVPHLLLAVDTPQPDLDFESTVFPTITTLAADGSAEDRRLLFRPAALPNAEGAFSDVISGPRAIAFTPDGKLALVANAQSEDVMVFDAETGFEVSLVRPLPSTMLEGIVVDHAGKHAYVDGRNTHDVTVLAIDEGNAVSPVKVDGASIDRLTLDPMPKELRLGQRLFYTANSAAFPVTKNFWVACTSCHIEGGSDAVTWLFAVGPRDTPSNAGGPINTGFLLRQALLSNVDQYDLIIRVEQGGSYTHDDPKQVKDLEALAAFVNYAIPFPQNPHRSPDGTLTDAQTRGQKTFQNLCTSCHPGPYYTDSAAGNAGLDFSQPVVLHDIGTCVKTGTFPDRTAENFVGGVHTACDFDTPTLRGIFATAPYFHDGSARTLRDVVDRLEFSSGLSDAEKEDLVAYMQTL